MRPETMREFSCGNHEELVGWVAWKKLERVLARVKRRYRFRKLGSVLWEGLLRLQKVILVSSAIILTGTIAIEVLFRYFLHLPLYGIEEVAAYSAMWLYFIGAAYGAFERSHISATLMEMLLKEPRTRHKLKVATSLITTVVTVWMCIWAYHYFVWGIQEGERSLELCIPMVYVQSSIFVGLILMSIYFFAEFLDNLHMMPSVSRSGGRLDD